MYGYNGWSWPQYLVCIYYLLEAQRENKHEIFVYSLRPSAHHLLFFTANMTSGPRKPQYKIYSLWTIHRSAHVRLMHEKNGVNLFRNMNMKNWTIEYYFISIFKFLAFIYELRGISILRPPFVLALASHLNVRNVQLNGTCRMHRRVCTIIYYVCNSTATEQVFGLEFYWLLNGWLECFISSNYKPINNHCRGVRVFYSEIQNYNCTSAVCSPLAAKADEY